MHRSGGPNADRQPYAFPSGTTVTIPEGNVLPGKHLMDAYGRGPANAHIRWRACMSTTRLQMLRLLQHMLGKRWSGPIHFAAKAEGREPRR